MTTRYHGFATGKYRLGKIFYQTAVALGVPVVRYLAPLPVPEEERSVTLDPADTADLKGSFYHELEMVLAGVTSTVAFGQIDIKKDLLE